MVILLIKIHCYTIQKCAALEKHGYFAFLDLAHCSDIMSLSRADHTCAARQFPRSDSAVHSEHSTNIFISQPILLGFHPKKLLKFTFFRGYLT